MTWFGRKKIPENRQKNPPSRVASLWKEACCLGTGWMRKPLGAQPSEGANPCPLNNLGYMEGALRDRGEDARELLWGRQDRAPEGLRGEVRKGVVK